jgi:hypothetical protein
MVVGSMPILVAAAVRHPARNVLKLYFTDRNYTLGEWKQLQYP